MHSICRNIDTTDHPQESFTAVRPVPHIQVHLALSTKKEKKKGKEKKKPTHKSHIFQLFFF